ncbi:hypothetical protein JET76_08845 [Pseudomonas putida]|uniref:hypothetical protein n=1 Tax=Pseudomonas TaxID=286 RepID=UPI000DB1B035|nr:MULTISPECIES: hypothetical protein [Pseudomonas]MBI6941445.1 hypothetical protein [Pseudomonas putida]MBI6957779.1 hypothetical protein [Pseudomonas putida]PZQ40345.1 MAG: hypothetical protein DI560_10450 [Pseudomonas putida]
MPYVTVNVSNNFDSANNNRYATPEEADARAREILAQFPAAQVFTAKVLKDYTAKVTVTAKDPAEPEPAPETPES